MLSSEVTLWALVDAAAAIGCLAALIYLWPRRQEQGIILLQVMAVSAAVVAFLDLLRGSTSSLPLALALARLVHLPEVLVALSWLGFAVAYTGQIQQLWRWPSAIVVALGGVSLVLTVAGDPGGWLVSGGFLAGPGSAYGVAVDHGLWHRVHIGFTYSTILFATGVLVLYVAQSPRHWSRLVYVLAAPVAVALPDLAANGGAIVPVWVELRPVGMGLATILLAWGLAQRGERGLIPVARSIVVEEMQDAVVVLDRDGKVVDVNQSARDTLAMRPLGDVPVKLGTLWAQAREVMRKSRMPMSERVVLRGSDGRETPFEVIMTPLGPQAGPDRTVLVLRDITKQVRLEEENREKALALKQLADTDELTKLANRRHLMEELKLEVERSRRYGGPLSLVILDLDRFKRVNDEHGHATGDEVLVETARAMEFVCRDPDHPARMGGEEFAVLLPETDEDGARVAADRLRIEIARRIHTGRDGREFGVTASVGVATLHPESEMGVDELIQAADEALYRAKSEGRNRVCMAGETRGRRPGAGAGGTAADRR